LECSTIGPTSVFSTRCWGAVCGKPIRRSLTTGNFKSGNPLPMDDTALHRQRLEWLAGKSNWTPRKKQIEGQLCRLLGVGCELPSLDSRRRSNGVGGFGGRRGRGAAGIPMRADVALLQPCEIASAAIRCPRCATACSRLAVCRAPPRCRAQAIEADRSAKTHAKQRREGHSWIYSWQIRRWKPRRKSARQRASSNRGSVRPRRPSRCGELARERSRAV